MVGGIIDSKDTILTNLQKMVKDREAWHAAVHGSGRPGVLQSMGQKELGVTEWLNNNNKDTKTFSDNSLSIPNHTWSFLCSIPVELFQILKDDAVKVLHSIYQQIWKTQQWPQDWKRSLFISIPKKGNPKECFNYHTIALISHASKVMLKILQARLQQYVNHELPFVQAGFRKGRGTRDQVANIHWIIEKAREFQKNIYFCFIDYAKAKVYCGSQ